MRSCHIVAEWLPSFAERLEIVGINTIFTESLDRVPENLHEGATVWFDPDSQVTDLFATARPAAVLFGADGMLAGGPVLGAKDIEFFVDDIVAELASAPLPEPPAFDPFFADHDHDHLTTTMPTAPTTTTTDTDTTTTGPRTASRGHEPTRAAGAA